MGVVASRYLKNERMLLERASGTSWSTLASNVACSFTPLYSFKSHELRANSATLPEYQAVSDELTVDARQGDRVTIDSVVYPVIRQRKYETAAST